MHVFHTSPFLRRVLLADAVTSGASGVLLSLGADAVGGAFGVPAALLLYSGLSLLPFAALLAYLATRERLRRATVWTIIVCNGLWALDSVLLLATGWVEPTALGAAFVIAQALVVATFAEVEYVGMRKSAPATA